LKYWEDPDTETKDKDWIYIQDLMQAIDELYITSRDAIDTCNNAFIAIAMYFKTLLLRICSHNKKKLQ
jgi:hypothetical protein